MKVTNRSTRGLAFLWLVLIGTNAAGYYAEREASPYLGYLILAGTVYFSLYFNKELLSLASFRESYLVLIGYSAPILLMLLADRSFSRGDYTSQIALLGSIVVASVLASRRDLDSTLTASATVIVCVGAAMNLFELFVHQNMWSTAPGRSAGFYINPNVSSMSLTGFASLVLLSRRRSLEILDLILMAVMVAGVFATFSRTGILLALLVLTVVLLARAPAGRIFKTVISTIAIATLSFWFVSYVVSSVDLSPDALSRVWSLEERGGVGDYANERGHLVGVGLDSISSPAVLMFGSGPLANYSLPETVHNTYIALLVDYGLVGVSFYLFLLIRLAVLAKTAGPRSSRIVWCVVGWLALWGVASHNVLNDGCSIVLLGFALAHARTSRPRPLIPAMFSSRSSENFRRSRSVAGSYERF